MKNKYLYAAIFLLSPLLIGIQPVFARVTEKSVARYNGPGNGSDQAYGIAVDSSGDLYVTGRSYGSGTDYDYTTIKYDSDGKEVWVARYNGPGNGSDEAYDIAVDSFGDLYVTGRSYGSGTDYDYATISYPQVQFLAAGDDSVTYDEEEDDSVAYDEEEDQSLFEIIAGATDQYENSESVAAIIELASLDGEIELEAGDEIEIEFDREEGKTKMKGPNPEALLAEIQEYGGLPVQTGQDIWVEISHDSKYKLKFENGTLWIEAPEVTLASPQFESGDRASRKDQNTARAKFSLSQNYPNPCNPETTVEYSLAESCHVALKIYNVSGQLIKTLINEYQQAGFHKITWRGDNDAGREVASGVYFYRIKAGDFASTKKMIVLK